MRIWLRDLRTKKGLTQEEVAERVSITRSYYTLIENNNTGRMPTVPVVKRIAAVLGFEWEKFYEDDVG